MLEQGLEGFCNQYLATKTMNSVCTIRGLSNFSGDPYYEPLARFMIFANFCGDQIFINLLGFLVILGGNVQQPHPFLRMLMFDD